MLMDYADKVDHSALSDQIFYVEVPDVLNEDMQPFEEGIEYFDKMLFRLFYLDSLIDQNIVVGLEENTANVNVSIIITIDEEFVMTELPLAALTENPNILVISQNTTICIWIIYQNIENEEIIYVDRLVRLTTNIIQRKKFGTIAPSSTSRIGSV